MRIFVFNLNKDFVRTLNKIISYPISIVFLLFFGLTLIIFHPIQWICLNVFGYEAHKKSVVWLNFFLLKCLHIVGCFGKIEIQTKLPKNKPVLIVSNHQSMWDIPPIIFYLRKYHPKFISKASLGKGIPSISYNLKHGGSILIDRKDKDDALEKMIQFTEYLNKNKRTGVIYPEGTRSKDGKMAPFKRSGMRTILEHLQEGYVIPVALTNTWKLQRWGMFPMQLGVKYEMTALPALKISDFEVEALIDKVEDMIKKEVEK